MKKFFVIFVFIAGATLGYCVGLIFPFRSPEKTPVVESNDVEGRLIAVQRTTNGSLIETGLSVPYDITGTYSATAVRLSPDKSRVVYSVWENAHVVVYVSGIDGTNARKIAEQIVPEGSGGIDVSSIRWEDAGHIVYTEVGLRCGKASCQTPDDFISEKKTYLVNVDTGKKINSNVNVPLNINEVDGAADGVDPVFPCGSEKDAVSVESLIAGPAGWETERLEYLCLVVVHPVGWRFAFSRSSPVPQPAPLTLMVPAKDHTDLMPVSFLPVSSESDIPEINMTVAEVRQKQNNIGGTKMEVYSIGSTFTDDQGISLEHAKYVLYSPEKQKAYLVKATYVHGEIISPDGPNVKIDTEKMLVAARAY